MNNNKFDCSQSFIHFIIFFKENKLTFHVTINVKTFSFRKKKTIYFSVLSLQIYIVLYRLK